MSDWARLFPSKSATLVHWLITQHELQIWLRIGIRRQKPKEVVFSKGYAEPKDLEKIAPELLEKATVALHRYGGDIINTRWVVAAFAPGKFAGKIKSDIEFDTYPVMPLIKGGWYVEIERFGDITYVAGVPFETRDKKQALEEYLKANGQLEPIYLPIGDVIDLALTEEEI